MPQRGLLPDLQPTAQAPKQLRFRLARDGALLTRVINAFVRTVFAWQRRRARALGMGEPLCGSVTFIQRFSSLLALSIHLHVWLCDGVFTADGEGKLSFHRLPAPSDVEVERLLEVVRRRVVRLCAGELDEPDDEEHALAMAQEEAVQLHLRAVEGEPRRAPLSSFQWGFSLHAGLVVHEKERGKLEKLLRYGIRPAFAQKRLTLTEEGRVKLKLRKPYFDGRTEVVFEPVAFLRRLAALIPPPRQHQVRFHGVFASRHQHRRALRALVPGQAKSEQLVLRLAQDENSADAGVTIADIPPERRQPWAALLKRVFKEDVLVCPKCSGKMRLIAFIKEPVAIKKILGHLGLPTEVPQPAPARAPPQLAFVDAA